MVCHLAAEVPILVIAAVEMSRGWRPLFDDATIAWRSWDVFSPHSPLVGHMTTSKQLAYGLGPLENWILAVPVRLDAGQGALWGAALACVVAAGLVTEAARSTVGWPGGIVASAAVLVVVITRPDLMLDLPWNPTVGIFGLMVAMAAGWAAASGRLGWWPVAVLGASLAAQCHELFVLPAAVICVASALVGLAARRAAGRPLGGRWWIVGLAVGFATWLPPVIQQLTQQPGNFTLLWRSARGSASDLGIGPALGGLGAAVRPFPDWLHIPARNTPFAGLVATLDSFSGPKGWAIVVLCALGMVAVVAWRTGRRELGALSSIALAAALSTVASVALFPSDGIVNFNYLDVVWWPVGMLTWIVLGWALVCVVRRSVRAIGELTVRGTTARCSQAAGIVAVSTLGAAAVWTNVPLTQTAFLGGWSMVHTTEQAAAVVARVAPQGPFELQTTGGHSNLLSFAVETGAGYLLHVGGYQPRFQGLTANDFGSWTRSAPGQPIVTVHLTNVLPVRVAGVTVSR